jgi:hypothetical protein
VGILHRCRITFDGSLGYFGCGLIDGPEITSRAGSAGRWREHDVGRRRHRQNAGSLTGAALRGGDVVVRGDVGARTGIDQKGGTIIVGGNAGSMTGFMLQRGRQIICGDVGRGLGDSMYDGDDLRRRQGHVAGRRLRPRRVDDADTEFVDRKFRIYALAPAEFQKFVCGRSSTTTTTSSRRAEARPVGGWQRSTPRAQTSRAPNLHAEVIDDIHEKSSSGRLPDARSSRCS